MVLVLKKIKGLGRDKDGLGLEKIYKGLVLQVMVLTYITAPKRGTSGGVHPPRLTSGQYLLKNVAAVSDTASDLTGN